MKKIGMLFRPLSSRIFTFFFIFVHLPSLATGSSNIFEAAQGLDSKKNLDIIKSKLEEGVNVNLQNEKGQTILMLATMNGNKKIAKFLLGVKDIKLDITDKESRTALFLASSYEGKDNFKRAFNAQIAEMLIDAGANANIIDKNNRSPLMQASKYGHVGTVKVLIVKGKANVNARSQTGETPLIMASSYEGDPRSGAPEKIVKVLITNKADVNATNFKGESALMRASVRGLVGAVEVLLANKAKPDEEDEAGKSALTRAKDNKHTQIVEILEKELESASI